MMSYEEFKERVQENFLDYLDIPNKELCEISIQKFYKVNRVLDSLTVSVPDSPKNYISPVIYVQEMYRNYEQGENLDEAFRTAARWYRDAMGKQMEDYGKDVINLDFENGRDKIYMVLVNTEQNEEMLKNVPSREFQDLSIVYRYLIKADKEAIASTVISNAFAKELGMTEPELYKAAAENTKELFRPKVQSMRDTMLEMLREGGMGNETIEQMIQDIPEERMMWVITNDKQTNGAASMMYEKILHDLAEKLGEDLLIMPSSVHEVIAVRESMGSPEELAQMVQDINMGQVRLEDRLSNQVYRYDRNLRELKLATDTPVKRLDGIVAEPGRKKEEIPLVREDGGRLR